MHLSKPTELFIAQRMKLNVFCKLKKIFFESGKKISSWEILLNADYAKTNHITNI